MLAEEVHEEIDTPDDALHSSVPCELDAGVAGFHARRLILLKKAR